MLIYDSVILPFTQQVKICGAVDGNTLPV